MAKAIKYVVALLVASSLLYFTLKDYNFAESFKLLQHANWYWLLPLAVVSILSHWFRALRWNMLLKASGYEVKTSHSFLAIMVGYFANYIFPRLGEVTRCGSLKNTDDVPIDRSLGTVVTERLTDVFTLFVILLLNIVLEWERLKDYINKNLFGKFDSLTQNRSFWVLIFFLSMALFFAWFFKEKLAQISFLKKIKTILSGFLEGMYSIFRLEKPLLFIAYSLVIWLMYYLSTYLVFFILPDTSHLSALAAMSVLVMGTFGVAAPTPGGIGAYHFFVSNLLLLYGLSADLGKTLALFLHGTQMIFTLVFGAICFVILLNMKKSNP